MTVESYTGASSPPRQPRQLPWLIFDTIIKYKKWPKQLGRFEGKKSLFFYQAKKLLILCLFCRIGKINIILPSKKSSWINWVLFAELKKWILLLFYQLLQKNGFIILLSKKKLLSLQTWKKMCLKTEVKVDFNIDGTKYF